MTTRACIIAAALTIAIVIDPVATALAAFRAEPSARHAVATLVVLPPATVTATSDDACAHVTVSWTASGVERYRVEVREGEGEWTELGTTTLPATSLEDAAGHVGVSVTYRVRASDPASGWESPSATTSEPLAC